MEICILKINKQQLDFRRSKDEEGIDILLKASVHKFINIRRMAVSALGKIGSIKGETVLIRALEDENSQVVTYAIKALNKIKSTKAKEKLYI
ncbi:HEAT repeat domain-containing protein [Clostridium botulinum]|nr:HEAT repeat domain-containing protein [Clostridium botulinum]